jgi:hypothetical protein
MTGALPRHLIGRDYRYVGTAHRWAQGLRVRVVAVHRGEEIIVEDALLDGPRPGDMVEFEPWSEDQQRYSWVQSDATWSDLERL